MITTKPIAPTTKNAILDAAEALFAENGFTHTSMRAITGKAEVNLAAVNYHFGSKLALMEALLKRRVKPMNEERLLRLEQLKAEHQPEGVPLEILIHAFAAPALELSRDTVHGGATFVRLLGRTYTEPLENIHDLLRSLYQGVIRAYKPAFAAVLPQIEPKELGWRLHFLVGLLAYLMAGTDTIRMIASSHLEDAKTELLMEQLVKFVSAGMQAEPATGGETQLKFTHRGIV